MTRKGILLSLILCLAASILASLVTGQVPVSPSALLSVLLNQAGLASPLPPATQEQVAVIWHIRLPRTLVGLLAGAALAVSGAVL